MSDITFSTETQAYPPYSEENPGEKLVISAIKFPLLGVVVGGLIGFGLHQGDAEGRLARLGGDHADKIISAIGGITISSAMIVSALLNSAARRQFQVPHPHSIKRDGSAKEQTAFLNAGRGFYNMVESLPFFLLNFYLAREVGGSPLVAGVGLTVWGASRIGYSLAYATQGPIARGKAFLVCLLTDFAMLGVCTYAAFRAITT